LPEEGSLVTRRIRGAPDDLAGLVHIIREGGPAAEAAQVGHRPVLPEGRMRVPEVVVCALAHDLAQLVDRACVAERIERSEVLDETVRGRGTRDQWNPGNQRSDDEDRWKHRPASRDPWAGPRDTVAVSSPRCQTQVTFTRDRRSLPLTRRLCTPHPPTGDIGEGCDKVTIRLRSSESQSLGIRAEPELPVDTRDPQGPEYTWRAAAVERDLSTAPLLTADGDQPLGYRRPRTPQTRGFLGKGIGDRRLQHPVPVPRDHPAAERHAPHGPPRSGDVAPVRTHLSPVELRRGWHQARPGLRRRAATAEGKDDPVPRRDQTEGGAGMARGCRNRGPRDGADEGHADVATHGRDDRPIEALVGSPRGPGRAGARGGRSAGERDGSIRDRVRCRVPALRLPPVRLPPAGEEARDQR